MPDRHGRRRWRLRSAQLRAACVVAVLAGLAAAPSAAGAAPAPPQPDARAWVLIDPADGERLAGRRVSRELSIASATKLMTAYLALRELPPDKRVKVPGYKPTSPAESLAGLSAGDRVSVRDLLYALLLPSANDAAVALADAVSGSVRKFVREMNRTAAALGLVGTSYENPIGLDSARNHSTAADLATLTRRLRREPLFRRIVASPSAVLRAGGRTRKLNNRNVLVSKLPWVDGVKTGHTLDARYVLVGSGTRKGVTLVSVVLGAPSESARDAGTLKLLDYGFSLYRRQVAVRDGEVVATPDLRYQADDVQAAAEGDLTVPVRRGQRIDTSVSVPDQVEGPIQRGERLGRVTATVGGRKAGSVPLVAARAAEGATVLEQARGRVLDPAALIAIGAGVILIGLVAARRAAGRRDRSPEERMRSQEERMRRRQQEREGEGERS